MGIRRVCAQLRTTDLRASIDFYVGKLGFELDFQYQDFYAGIRAGDSVFHLKLVDAPDPDIDHVREGDHLHLFLEVDDAEATAAELKSRGVVLDREVTTRPWGARDFYLRDDQGHTLCFSQMA